jgi:prepilin-type N-terminal cleavage/methylation domain-containing protein
MVDLSQQKGFTLLEALIAMLITGGALLGLGVVHLKSVQQSQLTAQRALVNIQANDLIDRLWADRCVINDTTKQNAIRDRWANNWNPTSTASNLTYSTSQLAMNQMVTDWGATLTPTVSNNIITYQLVISWKNAKAVWYQGITDTTGTQSLTYNFSIPKCTTP